MIRPGSIMLGQGPPFRPPDCLSDKSSGRWTAWLPVPVQWVKPLAFTLVAFGCTPLPKPDPHYVLGKPYQVARVWYYPREVFDLDQTGLAKIVQDDTTRLTTDGEVFDQTALAAGHAVIQLPAIARLTNLESGREVTVRLNDRGSGDPHVLVEMTKRTALLLGVPPAGIAQVRLRVLANESHAAADALPGAPSLQLTAAPRDAVATTDLAPPPGVAQGNARTLPPSRVAVSSPASIVPPPMRLPEAITQTTPRPGRLMVQLDIFSEYKYAAVQRARMGAAGARVVTVATGRATHFRVEIGPLRDVAQADSILDEALASGMPDARIVVD